jgi:GNAT superfamily N-acetyltransferase
MNDVLVVPDVDEPSVFIGNAAIHPKLRGKGLGAAMIADAKTIASKVGVTLIRLDTYGGKLGML